MHLYLYLFFYVIYENRRDSDDSRAFSTRLCPRQLRVIASPRLASQIGGQYITSGAVRILFIYKRCIGYMRACTAYVVYKGLLATVLRNFWSVPFACRSSLPSSVSENSKVNEKFTNKREKSKINPKTRSPKKIGETKNPLLAAEQNK